VWLDLYAGTGAVGIEALSRGARQVYLVESGKKHLKELNRKLSPQDGCWDVPWLGMYQDRLSRFLYVVTTGILPAFVIVLLFRQTLRSLVGLRTPLPAASNIVGVWVALILSISFGWLSWKYRPQVGSA
jgi:putative methyltransferase